MEEDRRKEERVLVWKGVDGGRGDGCECHWLQKWSENSNRLPRQLGQHFLGKRPTLVEIISLQTRRKLLLRQAKFWPPYRSYLAKESAKQKPTFIFSSPQTASGAKEKKKKKKMPRPLRPPRTCAHFNRGRRHRKGPPFPPPPQVRNDDSEAGIDRANHRRNEETDGKNGGGGGTSLSPLSL